MPSQQHKSLAIGRGRSNVKTHYIPSVQHEDPLMNEQLFVTSTSEWSQASPFLMLWHTVIPLRQNPNECTLNIEHSVGKKRLQQEVCLTLLYNTSRYPSNMSMSCVTSRLQVLTKNNIPKDQPSETVKITLVSTAKHDSVWTTTRVTLRWVYTVSICTTVFY